MNDPTAPSEVKPGKHDQFAFPVNPGGVIGLPSCFMDTDAQSLSLITAACLCDVNLIHLALHPAAQTPS